MVSPRPSLYYFAFGANMSTRVLERRGVTARSSEAARLSGYRLAFQERGVPLVEPAFATVIEDADSEVWGVLHKLDQDNLERIDAVEGPGYDLLQLAVEGRDRGQTIAHTYHSRQPSPGYEPSRRYLELLLEGAREFDLPVEFQSWLDTHPCAPRRPMLGWALSRGLYGYERLRRLLPTRASRRPGFPHRK